MHSVDNYVDIKNHGKQEFLLDENGIYEYN